MADLQNTTGSLKLYKKNDLYVFFYNFFISFFYKRITYFAKCTYLQYGPV